MNHSLFEKLAQRRGGIRLYGIAPPKSSTPPEQLHSIAAQQVARIEALDVDGLVVYDIQDESERIKEPRPFPFLPTLPADAYAQVQLRALSVPKVVYHSVARETPESFAAWLTENPSAPSIAVLVGAPSRTARPGLSLEQAYELVGRCAPELVLGAIAIAERHARRCDEHERMLVKMDRGCRFFVTQAVYDVTSTLSLLSDYAIATGARGLQPAPVILTFSPCGSEKTLAFMKWLGIAFPRWLENELRLARDPLETSLALCTRIFEEVWGYAREKGVPLGVNVESVSIRKAEIEASLELAVSLRGVIDRG
ncbi:MAG TPA: hypothetical protein VIM73_06830 [Polyangiaceae bacterium]